MGCWTAVAWEGEQSTQHESVISATFHMSPKFSVSMAMEQIHSSDQNPFWEI